VPSCYTYLSANQLNLTQNSFNLVTLDSEEYDIGSNFNIGTNRFVVPIPGEYEIIGELIWVSTSVVPDKAYIMGIYKNGSGILFMTAQSSIEDWLNNSIVSIVKLSANDYIQLYANPLAGVDTCDLNGVTSAETRLLIRLISKD